MIKLPLPLENLMKLSLKRDFLRSSRSDFLTNKRGFLLIICYIVIISFIILGSTFLLRCVTEKNAAQREKDWIQALHLAQAGVMRALDELRTDYNWLGTEPDAQPHVDLHLGEYWVRVEQVGVRRKIIARGFTPNHTSVSAQRNIEVFVEKKDLPANYFDNALYVSGDTTFNGQAYEVNGNVTYAGTLNGDTSNVQGTITSDSTISPLVRLDFLQLRQISEQQGNVYDAYRLQTDELPNSFWYDEAQGIPNIVYVESDLTLKGNIGTIGGFFVVVGDVLTDPTRTQDTTINGNGEIQGCIYTTGEFTINGGGGGLNVDGGVWAGEEATLNGNANVAYNATYMAALENLSLSSDVQIISWREVF